MAKILKAGDAECCQGHEATGTHTPLVRARGRAAVGDGGALPAKRDSVHHHGTSQLPAGTAQV